MDPSPDLKSFLRSLPDEAARDAFAERCGTSVGHLRNTTYGIRQLAPDLAAAIERESGGELKCEALRPDLHWQRSAPCEGWPNGRPLLDVAKEAA